MTNTEKLFDLVILGRNSNLMPQKVKNPSSRHVTNRSQLLKNAAFFSLLTKCTFHKFFGFLLSEPKFIVTSSVMSATDTLEQGMAEASRTPLAKLCRYIPQRPTTPEAQLPRQKSWSCISSGALGNQDQDPAMLTFVRYFDKCVQLSMFCTI